jgi:hypothetical protein
MCDAYRGSSSGAGFRDGIEEKRTLPRDMKKKGAMPTAASSPFISASAKSELPTRSFHAIILPL